MIDLLITEARAALLAPTGSFKVIDGAYSSKPLDDIEDGTPALFFFPGEDEGLQPTSWNPVTQTIIRRVEAWVLGEVAEIQNLCNQVRPVIVKHRPFADPTYTRLAFEKGKGVEVSGVMWYVETYYSQHRLVSA